MIARAVDLAYEAVRLALDTLAQPQPPAQALTADQHDDLDRHLSAARGSLIAAYQVVHGRLPEDVLAAEQARIMGRT